MKYAIAFASLAAVAAASTPAAAQPSRPVVLGAPGPFRDCAFGDIAGLNPRGDNFLSVRAAPRMSARETDRLGPRDPQVRVCERTRDGRWYGIVYRRNGVCQVDAPRRPLPYRGRCRAGWVSARYITISAG